MLDERQGIVHVIGPETGFSLPGTTIVSGDSHASTHGALGALAFGIGASEVEQVLATQTLLQQPSKNLRVEISGTLGLGCTPKDIALTIVGRLGMAGGTGHAIEYAGDTIRRLDMAGRMTVCNMSIETGARVGLIAPDETTFDWLRGREKAPKGEAFDKAVAFWRTLASDAGAPFDRELSVSADEIAPMVTWGTTPDAVLPITGAVPDPDDEPDPARRTQARRMLAYMDLRPGSVYRTSRSTSSSSAPAPTAASRTSVPPPPSPAADGRARRARAGRARLGAGEEAGGGGGARPHPARGRLRMARARLLDVPRHESRPADARPALRQHLEPQLRRPPGRGRPHAPDVAGNGSGSGRDGAAHRRAAARLTNAHRIFLLHWPIVPGLQIALLRSRPGVVRTV